MAQNDDPCPESGEVEYQLENALTTLENVQKELDSCNERLTASQISVSNARKQIESARKKSPHKEFLSQNSVEFLALKEECGSLRQRIRVMETEMESLREENCQLRESRQPCMNGCKCQAHIVRHPPLVHIKEEGTACPIPHLQFEPPKRELVDVEEPQLSSNNKRSEFDATERAPDTNTVSPENLGGKCKGALICSGCSKSFTSNRLFESHACRAPEGHELSCRLCDHVAVTSATLNRHEREVHRGARRDHVCPHCSKRFTFAKTLQRHLQTHIREKRFKCNKCKKRFKLKADLKRHERIHKYLDAKVTHVCQHCTKAFTCIKTLQRHLQSHIEEKPFECNDCKKRFKMKADLKRHQRIHTGEKPFECKLCHKRFNQSSGLAAHLRTTSRCKQSSNQPGNHKCPHCSKAFTFVKTLERHLQTHIEEEKPFECNECEKSFKLKGDLKRHERIHTGEKPFECKWCDRCFNQSSSLIRHEQTHKGQRP